MNFSSVFSEIKVLYGINWLSDKQSNLDHLNLETLKFTVLGKKNHRKIN